MTTDPRSPRPEPPLIDDIVLADLLRPVIAGWNLIVIGTLLAAAAAAVVGAIMFEMRGARWRAAVTFQTTFAGSGAGPYPSGQPFTTDDVRAPGIIGAVIERYQLARNCAESEVRQGFNVRKDSSAIDELISDYDRKFTTPGLHPSDRQRFEAELAAKRRLLTAQYELSVELDEECAPAGEQGRQVLTDVLDAWSMEALQNGALKPGGGAPSDVNFAAAEQTDDPLIVRADALRDALTRLSREVAALTTVPGVDPVRVIEGRSLEQLRIEVEGLQQRLRFLIGSAGPSLGPASMAWLRQSLQAATTDLQAAERRRDAVQLALREHAVAALPEPKPVDKPVDKPGELTTDTQSAHLDAYFQYRQELTNRLLEAANTAAAAADAVDRYRDLIKGTGGVPPAALEREFRLIIDEGRKASTALNQIYQRLDLLATGQRATLYRITARPEVSVTRAFTVRSWVFLVLGVAAAAFILLTAGVMFWPPVVDAVRRARAA